MNEVPNEDDSEEENKVPRGRITLIKRIIPTLAQESMLERRFNELISAIHNMIRAIITMHK